MAIQQPRAKMLHAFIVVPAAIMVSAVAAVPACLDAANVLTTGFLYLAAMKQKHNVLLPREQMKPELVILVAIAVFIPNN